VSNPIAFQRRSVMSALVTLGILLLAPATAAAAEMKYRTVSQFSKLDTRPVGDVDGHMTGTWMRRGVCLLTKEVGVYSATGTVDFTKGKGTAKGEASCTFADGSSFSSALSNTVEPLTGGLSEYKGTATFTGGTGRFAGIQGSSNYLGRTYTPMNADTRSDLVTDNVVKYTLPRKK
jgi:hypothetical protein